MTTTTNGTVSTRRATTAKKMMLACVLIVVCGTATAEESNPRGGYIGGGLGISTFDDGGAFAGLSFDDEDTSFQIHGGYKFLKYFAVEARYIDLGTFSVSALDIDVSATSIHDVLENFAYRDIQVFAMTSNVINIGEVSILLQSDLSAEANTRRLLAKEVR